MRCQGITGIFKSRKNLTWALKRRSKATRSLQLMMRVNMCSHVSILTLYCMNHLLVAHAAYPVVPVSPNLWKRKQKLFSRKTWHDLFRKTVNQIKGKALERPA